MTQETTGADQARKAMGQGISYPRLALPASGDRAHFHSLTTGNDNLFGGGQFHEWEDPSSMDGKRGKFNRVVCVESITGQPCDYCGRGVSGLRRYFGLWVYTYYILHMGNNPDEEGEDWEQVKWEDRTLFKEPVEAAQVLQLTAGRENSRFKQFDNQILEHGSLQTRMYQLKRQGLGLDTTYELEPVKNEPVPQELAAQAAELTPIVDLFMGTVNTAPKPEAIDTSGVPTPEFDNLGGGSGGDGPQPLMP